MTADTTGPKLLPCPFCGGEASAEGVNRYSAKHEAWWSDGSRIRESFFCNCISCGASMAGICGKQTREDAITAWNRRAACSSLPHGPGFRVVPSEHTVDPKAWDRMCLAIRPAMTDPGFNEPADIEAGERWRGNASNLVRSIIKAGAVSLPDGGAAERDYADTEALPDDFVDELLACVFRTGAKRDFSGDYIFPPMDSNEVFALMTGVPLPARYGEAWVRKFRRAALAAPSAQPPVPEGWKLAIRYDVLYEHARKHNWGYNHLCCAIREACSPSAQPSGAPEVQPEPAIVGIERRVRGGSMVPSYQVRLAIGVQSFNVNYVGTWDEANFTADMLRKALARAAPTPSGAPADTTKALMREAVRAIDPASADAYTDEQLSSLVRAASEDHDWLPIDTAPKDGTRVILSWGGKSINGFYLDNSRTSTPWAGWRVESMVTQPAGSPTHWQPFPAALTPLAVQDATPMKGQQQ